MLTTLPLGTPHVPEFGKGNRRQTGRKPQFPALVAVALLILSFASVNVLAQVNGVGRKPYLGWSTFSEQTIVPSSSVMNEQNILMQSDTMRSSGLQAHGFRYI